MLGNRKSSINSNYCINDILVYYADIKFYEIQDVCLTTKGNSMDEDPTSSTDNHIRCTIKATFWTKTQQVAFSFFSAFSSALTLHKHGGVCGCKKKKKEKPGFSFPSTSSSHSEHSVTTSCINITIKPDGLSH